MFFVSEDQAQSCPLRGRPNYTIRFTLSDPNKYFTYKLRYKTWNEVPKYLMFIDVLKETASKTNVGTTIVCFRMRNNLAMSSCYLLGFARRLTAAKAMYKGDVWFWTKSVSGPLNDRDILCSRGRYCRNSRLWQVISSVCTSDMTRRMYW